MSAQPAIFNPGRVLVADGVLYLRELEESDGEVVRIVAEAADPAGAVSQCLRIGARAMRAAHVTVDVDVIERSFSRARDPLRDPRRPTRSTRSPAPRPASSTPRTGALTGTLSLFRTEFEQLLGDTFDPDSKRSVLAKVETLVEGVWSARCRPSGAW